MRQFILEIVDTTFALVFQMARVGGESKPGNILTRSYMHWPAAHYIVDGFVSSTAHPSQIENPYPKKI